MNLNLGVGDEGEQIRGAATGPILHHVLKEPFLSKDEVDGGLLKEFIMYRIKDDKLETHNSPDYGGCVTIIGWKSEGKKNL